MRPPALFLLLALPLAAADIEFKERFIDPATRPAALQSLVPGTRDWFFYHTLDHQLAGRDAECRATLQHWRAAANDPLASPPVAADGLATLEHRAAILRYQRQPETALAELAKMLELDFDHARPDARTEEALPSRLDPPRIVAAAFEAAAARSTDGKPWQAASNQRLLAQLADPETLTPEQRRWLLERLDFAHHPTVVPLVAADLAARDAKPFGAFKVHRLLASAQLAELLRLHPPLVNSEAFVKLHLQKLRPGTETDFALDLPAHAAHLARCREFVLTLPPAFNSLKAHVLHHHLRLQRELGQLPADDLLAYLALPRPGHPLLREIRPADPAWNVEPDADFAQLTGCPPVGDDSAPLRHMLERFLSDKDDAKDCAPYLPAHVLTELHARARLLAGAEPAAWGARLDPAAFAALQQETRVDFAPGQPRFFAPDAPVKLALDLKHTPELLVRIHELDLPAYIALHGAEPPADLDLAGLVPHAERTLRFDQPPLVRHRESIDLPELTGRGAWVVEFIARGVASRALVRKGRLVPYASPTADGMLVRVFDENGALLRDATATVGAQVLTADDQGRIMVPRELLAGRRTAVVRAPGATPQSPGLAAPLTLDALRPADFALDARFHADRESLAAGRDAQVRVELRLTRHGRPLPPDQLRDRRLVLTAILLGGAEVERVVGGELPAAASFTVPFHVPADALALEFRLTGRVDVGPGSQPLELSAAHQFNINGILETARIAAALFVPTPAGHLLEIRGRNGEPLAGRTVPLRLRHRDFAHPFELTLRTDPDGRIELGPLTDIALVETSADWLEDAIYQPAATLHHAALPAAVHLAAGEELRLPLAAPPARLDPARFVLLEFGNPPGLPLRDHFQQLALADGELLIRPLPAGSYQLTIPGDSCQIEVSAGAARDDLLVAPARILPRLRPATPRIARAAVEGDAVVVQLAGHGPQARVHLLGTAFAPGWPARDALAGFAAPLPPTLVPGFATSAYQVGRILDEETRYILERRAANTFPGSLLPRAGLLLNRFTTEEDEGAVLQPRPGRESTGREGGQRAPAKRRDAGEPPLPASSKSFPSIDFLGQPPLVRYDLQPAADGTVRVPLAAFAGCRLVTATATEAGRHFQAAVPLPAMDPPLRDRRLARPLDPAKHFLGARRTAVLAAGAEAVIDNALDPEWRAFTTLAEVHAWFLGAHKSRHLADFAFLTEWPKLDENRKLALLSSHACHEFHLFLARKDPDFFAKHVKPTLAEKREPQFLDDYLLGGDLAPYLRPFTWNRLNAAEQALLAQALPAARARVLADLQHRWELEAPTPAAETLLFTRTLRRVDVTAQAAAGGPEQAGILPPLDDTAADGASYILQKLRTIILPVVDFEDTSVEEAIDFLRMRTIELDDSELDPSRKGIGFVIRRPRVEGTDRDTDAGGLGLGSDPAAARIPELKLRNVPLATVLKYICDATRLRYKVDDFAVTIVPATETSEDLFTRTFNVPPDFMANLADTGGGDEVDPFAPEAGSGRALMRRQSVQELLKEKGVPFPDGASASYNPATGTLILRNTPTNIDLVEQLTEASYASLSPEWAGRRTARGFAGAAGDAVVFSDTDADMLAAMDPFAAPPELPNSFGLLRPRRATIELHADRTRVWREHDYYLHSSPTDEGLAPLGRFWLDLAAWDGKGRFLSPHFNACTATPNESLLCLALLDLPFEAPPPEVRADGAQLRVRAKQPLLLFFKDTREAGKVAADSPLLVRQGFHRLDDRFRTVAGRKVENTVDGGFLAGVPYAASLVVTNPTGTGRRVELLAQVPAGAIPLAGHLATLSESRDLDPYGVLSLETAFYFPAAGRFPVYPLHVGEDSTVLAHAAPRTLEVAGKPAGDDRRSWPAVARDGSPEEVLARLRADNLHAIDVTLLCWRLRERKFFLDATAILRERLHFVPEVFAYGFHHHDLPAIRDYLENSQALQQLGGWFESPLVEVRPSVHLGWQSLEFDPLVNPRAHRFADHPRLTHEQARDHYGKLLDLLAWKPAPGPDDQLVLAWFLLLQDRVEEALARFARVDPAGLTGSLIYDYLHCHVLFYQSRPAEARALAERHRSHPLALWRDRFAAVLAQADEISAAAKPGEPAAAAPGQAAPQLELAAAPDGSLVLSHRMFDRATLRLHGIDLEHLFSNNPFLDQHGGQHAAVRPNHVLEVALDPAAATTRVELPPAFRRGNVLVTADAGPRRAVLLLDSRALELRRDPATHLVQVLATAAGTPLPRCYVKVFAELDDGKVTFYKDGYTDLRGKFDYLAHTAIDPATVKRLAVLVAHPDHGSRTGIFTP